MSALQVIACEAIAILGLLIAVAALYVICKQVDAVDPASSIGHWTTKRPFFFFTTFRSHRMHYRQSLLVGLYWFSGVLSFVMALILQWKHEYPFWLQTALGVIGLGLFVIRFTSPYSEPMFSQG